MKSLKLFSPDIPHLYVREKSFVFHLVIPAHLRGFAGKSEFKASLKTKDHLTALRKYGEVEPYYQSLMDKLCNGKTLTSASDLSYEEIVKIAEISPSNTSWDNYFAMIPDSELRQHRFIKKSRIH